MTSGENEWKMDCLNADFFSKKYKIIIWGCGVGGVRIIQWLRSQGMQVSICVDSSPDKQGTVFMDEFVVKAPAILSEVCEEYHVVVTAMKDRDVRDIFALLDSYGYVSRKNYIELDDVLNYCADLLISYITKQNYRTKFIFPPNLKRMDNCSNTEQMLLNMPAPLIDRISWLLSFPRHIKECYKNFEYYSQEYLENIYTGSETLEYNRTYIMREMHSRYVNVVNGMRFTTDQPKYHESTVHLFGNSYVYGFGVEDKYTLPSCLQRKFNNESVKYIVYNYGVRGLQFENYINKIQSATIREDDYVLLYFKDEPCLKQVLMRRSIPYIDVSEFLIKKRSDDIFFDWGSHLNYKGNLIVSDILFELLFSGDNKNKISETETQPYEAEVPFLQNNPDFNDYIAMLREVKSAAPNTANGVNGGIVMNCNPFTSGHRHLIKVASQMVDNLYVFVVSENRSQFDFEDRINMVKAGTEDIENVTVLPSGKFILSAVTFPEYFSKDEEPYAAVDTSRDIDIFGAFIAKELDISIRFVGEEPIDMVTKQYNESMKAILPKYNIKVLEIPRIKLHNQYISASIVRKLLQKGDLQELRKYVPESTYQYILSQR